MDHEQRLVAEKQRHSECDSGATLSNDGLQPVVPSGVGPARAQQPTPWAGEKLLPLDGYLAISIVAGSIELERIPPLVALVVSDGDRVVRVEPAEVGRFVLAHRSRRWVFAGVAADFWAVAEHLTKRGEADAHEAWWTLADDNRLHDLLLLDGLVRLADTDADPDPRSLAEVVREHAKLTLAGGHGPVESAAGAVLAIKAAYPEVRREGLRLAWPYRWRMYPDALQRFGLLTEFVQVRKAIALAQVTRNGMHVDLPALIAAGAEFRRRLEEAVAEVLELCPGLYEVGAGDRLNRRDELLRERLGQVSGSGVPTAEDGVLPVTRADWQHARDADPFVAAWLAVEDHSALLPFFAQFDTSPVAHPRYQVACRTGRAVATDPPVQCVPHAGPFRAALRPAPGHLLLSADVRHADLLSLAAVCLLRYELSTLANVLRGGGDPHAYTAARILGMWPEQFEALRQGTPEERRRYDQARHAAKAVNLGVPVGMGPRELQRHLRRRYGVRVTAGEARRRREELLTAYHEVSQYLADDYDGAGAVTPTGRLRGRVRPTAARNTPFQGLSADGAGLALYRLVREGFRVVGFVHDEVLVELPEEDGSVAEEQVRRVEQILRSEVAGVLTGGIPATCHLTLGESWADRREVEYRGGRAYPAGGGE